MRRHLLPGIFVNDDGLGYAQDIVHGRKCIETRNRDMLGKLVGKMVAVVQTGRGLKPTVIGYAYIHRKFFCSTPDEWEALRDRTLIPPGTKRDAFGRGKWCYGISDAGTIAKPFPIPDNTIRHGRSWCEIDLDSVEWR